MTSLVVQLSYEIKLNISISKTVKKILSRCYIMTLTHLFNTIEKLWEKISFHEQFKYECTLARKDTHILDNSEEDDIDILEEIYNWTK